jgi:hypothetical protein
MSPTPAAAHDGSVIVSQYQAIIGMIQLNYTRRTATNRFYLSLGSALVVFLTYVVDPSLDADVKKYAAYLVASVGLVLCLVWGIQIRSLRSLIGIQVSLAIELERQLPFNFLERQHELQNHPGYFIRYGFVEQLLPFVMCLPFLMIMVVVFLRY